MKRGGGINGKRLFYIHMNIFKQIISTENIVSAWQEFLCGKRNKYDVQLFSLNLMSNIFRLQRELEEKRYIHGLYHAFRISDPKPRDIHKASVRDRLLHHVLYRVLYPLFDTTFIADSFSCRNNKGTHKALQRFQRFVWRVGKNNTKQCWVLKCDIRKFFASIDHETLVSILEKRINDADVIWLCKEVIKSFETEVGSRRGLPLGNLTSQLFANVYMNEFDQYIKHTLKVKHYIRYADDFAIFSNNKDELEKLIPKIRSFLSETLHLSIHDDKLFIETICSGVDFLGWVHFSNHRVVRTRTKRRMMKRIEGHPTQETINSYLGLLKHGNTEKLKKQIDYFTFLKEKDILPK
ncbi:MAG: RNA-directed DNA polymerase (Reverse transcriptase) [Parcubacteria group bacterium LiPW_41]|nr:MAG: RNA-directed DNA polymerase (Reverse transcriptase) [Parcubacteria group bacterium LiPW_41]